MASQSAAPTPSKGAPRQDANRRSAVRRNNCAGHVAQPSSSTLVYTCSPDGCSWRDLFRKQIGQQTNTEMLGLFSDGPSHKYELKTRSLTNQRLTLFAHNGFVMCKIGNSTSSIAVRAIAAARLGQHPHETRRQNLNVASLALHSIAAGALPRHDIR